MNGAHDTDSHGHGTHVAGTIAGTKHGVAKNASIVAVKVFPDGSGMTSTSDIIKGLDWSLQDAQAKNNTERCVVNMSVGGPYSAVFNSAVEKAVQNGIVVVVAAANSGVSQRLLREFLPPYNESLHVTDLYTAKCKGIFSRLLT